MLFPTFTLVVLAGCLSYGNSQILGLETAISSYREESKLLSVVCKISAEEAKNFIKNFTFVNIDDSNVTFHIYKSLNETTQVSPSNISTFLTEPKTVILIHGWGGNKVVDYITWVADAYVKAGGYNIISVDWSGPSANSYCVAATSVKDVGRILSNFIVKTSLQNPGFLPGLHVFGHSLGAQVAGFAGRNFYSMTKSKLPWITGADAAGPLFTRRKPFSNIISKADGEFVVLIHTNIGLYGAIHATAHVDFYVNCGGPIQKECREHLIGANISENIIKAITCSHQTSCRHYADAILNPDLYKGGSCLLCAMVLPNRSKSSVAFGETIDKTATGSYCMSTR